MSIDGAGKLHFFVTFVTAAISVSMVASNSFETRLAGFALLVACLLFFAKFYEKL